MISSCGAMGEPRQHGQSSPGWQGALESALPASAVTSSSPQDPGWVDFQVVWTESLGPWP